MIDFSAMSNRLAAVGLYVYRTAETLERLLLAPARHPIYIPVQSGPDQAIL